MAQRSTSDVVTAVKCVRTAMRKCGVSTREFFRRALRGKKVDEIDDEVEEFDDLPTGENIHFPRHYRVPDEVYGLARAVAAHSDPSQVMSAQA
jgi:hypothetical protein